MYPQFAENQHVRGIPDMARNPIRFPHPSYYGHKMIEGMSYPGMNQPGLNPYAGKPLPDPMYGGPGSWNSMMLPPGMGPMHKPVLTNKPDYVYPGQEPQHMYRTPYHPEMMNSAGPGSAGGGYPGYMYPYHQHPSSYMAPPPLPPHPQPHHMDGYPVPHQPNNIWDGTTPTAPPTQSTNINSPGNWTTHHSEMLGSTDISRPPSTYQSTQSPKAPPPPNDLQKGGSVTSLKDALSTTPQSLHESQPTPSSNKPYQFNTSYLTVGGESLSHTSPQTPNTARTPDPATPVLPGIMSNNEGVSPLPAPPPQVSSNLGNNARQMQNSPLEVEAILGLKDGRAVTTSMENGESFPPQGGSGNINSKSPGNQQHHKPISPTSSAGSPLNKKLRSPLFSPIDRNHSSLANQYNMSDEPGRKDFLDALFKHMEQEGIVFLKPPSINKNVLDLYKTFTAVQSLGGFMHVVDKRLWKDVLKSFSSATNPSSASMRTLSEYYVKILLPYECHFSHTNFHECMAHYEMSHRSSTDTNENSNQQPDRTKSLDTLLDPSRENLLFSEDSQGSLDSFSNQPLPDISVQEAESVLGISSSGTGPTTPSPSFPHHGWSSPSGGGGGGPTADHTLPDTPYAPPHHPNYHNYYGSSGPMPDYGNYQKRNLLQYMSRGYPGYVPSPPLDDGSYGYPNMGMMTNAAMHRMDEYAQHGQPGMGGGDWMWSHPQSHQRPRLPPPLPAHLQSQMFMPPPAAPPPPVAASPMSSSPVPATPMQLHQQTPPAADTGSTNSASLDPVKIMVSDSQQHSQSHGVGMVDRSSTMANKPSSDINESKLELEKVMFSQQQLLPVKRNLEPVENIQPQLVKRKRLNCTHCGKVEPWRVMMSLKCGLPSDSTWALDTLNILLHDDQTVGFFYLKHHHSLLNTLVNHFNSCLFEIFGKPFQVLDKFDKVPSKPGIDSPPPSASVYHHTDTDVRLGYSDHICHLSNSCAMVDSLPDSDPPPTHPLRQHKVQDIQKVDETVVEQLKKRDTLTERVLLHLKTPRRIMARSPIQKYFLSAPDEDLPPSPLYESLEYREENEVVKKEELPLCVISSRRDTLKRRTLALSNILRSLSFIPGNDIEFSQHPGLLLILGNLLMLHHVHLQAKDHQSPLKIYQEPEDEGEDPEKHSIYDTPPTIQVEYWWWSCLDVLRENMFVILANISGQLDISIYPEAISYPIINGLLHWLVCPSSVATDSLPDSAMVYSLSPQRLVVESLAKMSISEVNIDYIVATPPLTRLDLVYATLLQFIGQKKYPAVRQFALVFISNLAQGSEGASRMIGQQKMTLPLLLECIESSIITAKSRYVSSQYTDDINSLSLAMLRRAAITLHCLAKVPVNRISFLPYCNRVLALSMSDALDPSLTSILSDVLYELTRLL